MKTTGNEPLRELLAAEYALGTLRDGARRRFERWMREDAELRALAFAWSERLAPLIDAVESHAPPSRVWDAIEARLPGFSARHGSAAPRAAAWWDRLGLWRGLSAAFAVIAAVAIALAIRPAVPPEILTRTETQVVEVETLPLAVATLTDPKSGAPVAVVMASKTGRDMVVKIAADVKVGEGKVLQLWSTPNGKDLVSMGVLPAVAAGESIHLTALDVAQVGAAKAIGLSLEPAGGSPQPTHVLGLGALVRLTG
jgi:anti-sigma-K factor RskA